MAPLFGASHMLGIIFTPISWRGTLDEIAYCLEDCEAAAVAYDGAAGGPAQEAAARLRIDPRRQIVASDGKGDGVRFETLLDAAPVAGPVAPDESSTCLMLYTSGTTGRPKGVPRSHRAELAAGVSQVAHHLYRMGESSLCVLPMFHTMGVRKMLASALVNRKLVCMPDDSPQGVARQDPGAARRSRPICRRARPARSSAAWRARRLLPAIGSGRMPTPKRSRTHGTAPATSASSIRTASFT